MFSADFCCLFMKKHPFLGCLIQEAWAERISVLIPQKHSHANCPTELDGRCVYKKVLWMIYREICSGYFLWIRSDEICICGNLYAYNMIFIHLYFIKDSKKNVSF